MPVSIDAGMEGVVVVMARGLRAEGVAVPPDATVSFAVALAEVGLDRRSSAYWAGRATLIHRPEDVAAYDEVFSRVFDRRVEVAWGVEPEPDDLSLAVDTGDPTVEPGGGTDEDERDGRVVALRWSEKEVLRDKDFARCTPDELAEAHRLLADVRVRGARRPSRRLRPTRRSRGTVDLRATIRRSLRSGGEPMKWAHRAPGRRLRRVVLLCDISGSMEPYARALVRFAHVTASGLPRAEVFTLGTRCTRVTRQLRTHDPDLALAAVGDAVEDWSGGTRLGEGIRAFNDGWGVRGLARGAVVVVLSDGWDRGDPDLLSTELARLALVAHRLIWVNPLMASPGFAPVATGMAAALPHVDDLVEGHSVRALEDLVAVIGR